MSLDEVRRAIGAVPGVHSAHDLHVWSITSGNVTCSVHVVVDDIAQAEATRNRVAQMLAQALQVDNATTQTESQECAEARYSDGTRGGQGNTLATREYTQGGR